MLATCKDNKQNGNETGIDCGGSCAPCKPNCSVGTNGSATFCGAGNCLCGTGQGACHNGGECQGGLTCSNVITPQFPGLATKTKICVALHCLDGVKNSTETGIDCGGECGSCLTTCSGTLGSETFCDGCLCTIGQGDCDATSQCDGNLVCAGNQGTKFGLGKSVDVCTAAHCTNGVLDGSETDVDCGGECGLCAIGEVDAGLGHTCAVDAGTVKCWGYNAEGQIGDGTTTTRPSPTVATGLTGYALVAAGGAHSCAVSTANVVKCWGRNAEGQLGVGSTTPSASAVTVSSPPAGIKKIRAGGNTTCVVTAAGTVWCWGSNSSGQAGTGSIGGNQTTPAQVAGITTAVDVAVGLAHTCAALSDGSVRCWGANGKRQLGENTNNPSGTPQVVALPAGTLAVEVSAGDDTACARTSTGTVVCWGNNAENALGVGAANNGRIPTVVPGITGAVSITSGSDNACAVRSDHNILCWGFNGQGQDGAGTTKRIYTAPILVENTLARGFTVTGGGGFICSKTILGGVSCWGNDNFGQLGKGTIALRAVPTAVSSAPANVTTISAGDVSTCAVAGGALYCWGNNDQSELGDGTNIQRRIPTLVAGGYTDATAVAVGGTHACARRSGGSVVCWGTNTYGELGNNTTTPSAVPVSVAISTVTAIGAGQSHACSLLADGSVRCWGRNADGQLGNGVTTDSSSPVVVSGITGASALTVGQRHNCAIVSGAVRCWGNNVGGQLGNGTTTGSLTPVAVSLPAAATVVAAGQLHTCARLTTGAVYCWGSNVYGQLGNGSAVTGSPTPVLVSGITTATSVTTWGSHTCALLSNSTIRCWGLNTRGNLGASTVSTFSNVPLVASGLYSFISAGGRHTCGKQTGGSLRCWGYNDFGQVGDATSWLYPASAATSL